MQEGREAIGHDQRMIGDVAVISLSTGVNVEDGTLEIWVKSPEQVRAAGAGKASQEPGSKSASY